MPKNIKTKLKQGKPRFWGRVDVKATLEPIAELRRVIIEELEKYPDSMEFFQNEPSDFVEAIQRHLDEIYENQDVFCIDEETGLPHFFAIGFNYMVISMFYNHIFKGGNQIGDWDD